MSRATPLVYLNIGSAHPRLNRPLSRALHRFYTKRASVVVAVSESVAEDARSLHGIPDEKLVVISNGRDATTYAPASSGPRIRPRLIWVGQIDVTKRPEWFLELTRSLVERGHDVEAIMVGDGPRGGEISLEADAAGVTFLGSRDDVPDLMRDSDILVFTGRPPEGMPGVLIEAGLCGLPVVSTRVPGAEEVVEDGSTGVLVEIEDDEGLLDAVESLVANREMRSSMGREARRRCTELFALETTSLEWKRLLDELISGHRPLAGSANAPPRFRVAHLTTVDLSLKFLVYPQLRAVIEAGGEAVGISAPGPWVDGLRQDGIEHIPLPSSTRGVSPINDLRAALELWRVLQSESFAVLHTHNPKPGLYGRLLGRLAGVPLVVNTLHGLYATDRDSWTKRAAVFTLEAIAARFSDVELHQNPEDLEFGRATRLLPKGKGCLLGNGVDLQRFDPGRFDASARKSVRAEWGVGDDEIVVGMVGRLVAEKGYPELFTAASRLGRRYRVIAIGPDDPDKPDALDRSEIRHAAEAGVSLLGMRNDVDRLYRGMDVFVLPSHREGFPRAAMEAAAMGLPVIATNIRGCRQVVDEGVNGFLVPVQDPSRLIEKIEVLGDDPGLRSRMGEASRRIALERFDERLVVERVMGAYREGLVAKGLGHLLPAQMVGREGTVRLRSATVTDATTIATMHMRHIGTGFLPRLGLRFMRLLYRVMISWPGSSVLVLEDEGGPVGFVAGVLDTGAFYRHFYTRFGFRATLAALPLILRPSNLRGAWESLVYGRSEGAAEAELLAMVVAPRARGRGQSLKLGEAFLRSLADRGATSVRVVVGANNAPAVGAYRRMGFADHSQIGLHAGSTSEVMVWQA